MREREREREREGESVIFIFEKLEQFRVRQGKRKMIKKRNRCL